MNNDKKLKSKKLDTVQGVNVNNQYHSKQIDAFSKMMLATFRSSGEPIKHKYYELVNKKGKVTQIVLADQEVIVQSAAHRLGLDYRLVEFNETWEDLDKEEKSDASTKGNN